MEHYHYASQIQCHKTATPNVNTSLLYVTYVLLQNISTTLLQYLLAKYVLWALANFPLQRSEQTEFIILHRGLSFSSYTVLPLALTRIYDTRRWGGGLRARNFAIIEDGERVTVCSGV